ncbi:MAG TPA: biopolymer transporter ExbD [Pirellulales bacterium]|nr:biopolymer transporter ExbD [Pirellulales bacterium]
MVAANTWRVRKEDDSGVGRAVGFERLAKGIEDGVWSETDQVRGPHDAQWLLVGEHPQLEEFVPPRRLFRPSNSEEAEMDMTPMIDVTFQLLIFFMIAATFVVQKTLSMPRAEASEEEGASTVTIADLAKDNIMVKVAADGSVTLQGAPVPLDGLTDALNKAVREHSQAGHQSTELVLDVADEVEHQTVVAVIDAAGGAQIEKVHFVSRKPPATD